MPKAKPARTCCQRTRHGRYGRRRPACSKRGSGLTKLSTFLCREPPVQTWGGATFKARRGSRRPERKPHRDGNPRGQRSACPRNLPLSASRLKSAAIRRAAEGGKLRRGRGRLRSGSRRPERNPYRDGPPRGQRSASPRNLPFPVSKLEISSNKESCRKRNVAARPRPARGPTPNPALRRVPPAASSDSGFALPLERRLYRRPYAAAAVLAGAGINLIPRGK